MGETSLRTSAYYAPGPTAAAKQEKQKWLCPSETSQETSFNFYLTLSQVCTLATKHIPKAP